MLRGLVQVELSLAHTAEEDWPPRLMSATLFPDAIGTFTAPVWFDWAVELAAD